ncbi:MAG: myo-inositol-1(or 4)-monophosphatase [Lentimonas sp.]|jgi:myo-inositol-1(or 4)-monophosphatase
MGYMITDVLARLDAIESMLPELERMLLEMQQGDLGIDTKTTEVDLVTKADFASEQCLIEFIRTYFPEDGIVSEEGSQSVAEAERSISFRWILDPIDGTVNYANRIPGWAISIGLLFDGEPVAGIVTAPALRERFRAIKGLGATFNGKPIRVNEKSSLREGLVVTGFPYDRAQRAAPLCAAMENMLRESGGVRRLGAAALDFCYVADGRFVGYYEMALKPWDAAAGSLIAREAGAQITDLAGEPYDLFANRGVAVSNGRVHAALVGAAAPMLDALAV